MRSINLQIKRLNKKLNTRLYKLFEIIKVINTQVYKLKLFRVYKIHSILYVSLLKSYRLNIIKNRIASFLFSIEIVIKNDEEYEKYKLIKISKFKRVRERLNYYVR